MVFFSRLGKVKVLLTERMVTTMTENELFGISEQLDDTISRQAAIDALDEICDRGRETH